MAETTAAYTALWRYCLDVDLMRTITAGERSPEEPLVHLLAEPRRLRITLQDGLWVRPVDVPAALSARRYARDGQVVLAVRDALCPWNDGRFELDGGPEGAGCRASDRDPDLELEAADLGAAYLGGTRLRILHRAGRVRELRPGAVAAADRMFSWDPLPWCPEIF
jgi:predicted acetyltransferase